MNMIFISIYIFQATLPEFGWRNAFKEISFVMAHSISAAIEGFSTKVLQQEQTERSSAVSYAINLVTVPKVWREGHIFPEEEQPKKVAKASTRGDRFLCCWQLWHHFSLSLLFADVRIVKGALRSTDGVPWNGPGTLEN